jgi:hypothetical protein
MFCHVGKGLLSPQEDESSEGSFRDANGKRRAAVDELIAIRKAEELFWISNARQTMELVSDFTTATARISAKQFRILGTRKEASSYGEWMVLSGRMDPM